MPTFTNSNFSVGGAAGAPSGAAQTRQDAVPEFNTGFIGPLPKAQGPSGQLPNLNLGGRSSSFSAAATKQILGGDTVDRLSVPESQINPVTGQPLDHVTQAMTEDVKINLTGDLAKKTAEGQLTALEFSRLGVPANWKAERWDGTLPAGVTNLPANYRDPLAAPQPQYRHVPSLDDHVNASPAEIAQLKSELGMDGYREMVRTHVREGNTWVARETPLDFSPVQMPAPQPAPPTLPSAPAAVTPDPVPAPSKVLLNPDTPASVTVDYLLGDRVKKMTAGQKVAAQKIVDDHNSTGLALSEAALQATRAYEKEANDVTIGERWNASGPFLGEKTFGESPSQISARQAMVDAVKKRDNFYAMKNAELNAALSDSSGGASGGGSMSRFALGAVDPNKQTPAAQEAWSSVLGAVRAGMPEDAKIVLRDSDFVREEPGSGKLVPGLPAEFGRRAKDGAVVYDETAVKSHIESVLDMASGVPGKTNGQLLEDAGFSREKAIDYMQAEITRDNVIPADQYFKEKTKSDERIAADTYRENMVKQHIPDLSGRVKSLEGQITEAAPGLSPVAAAEHAYVSRSAQAKLGGLKSQLRSLEAGIRSGALKGEGIASQVEALQEEITRVGLEVSDTMRSVTTNADGSPRLYNDSFLGAEDAFGKKVRTDKHWGNILVGLGGVGSIVTPLLTTFWLNPRAEDKRWEREKEGLDLQYQYWLKQFAVEQQGSIDRINAQYAGAASVKSTPSGGGGGSPGGNSNITLASAK